MCSRVRWRVVAHYNHVQVSPAYLRIHTRPAHEQYTLAFHPALWHSPSRAMYLQTHPTAQGAVSKQSLPGYLSLPCTTHGEGRLHWTSTEIKLHWWPTDTTALVGMYLCSKILSFMLACPWLFFLRIDVDKMPDLKGKQNKFNLKKTFIWSSFKSHSLTDDNFLPFTFQVFTREHTHCPMDNEIFLLIPFEWIGA